MITRYLVLLAVLATNCFTLLRKFACMYLYMYRTYIYKIFYQSLRISVKKTIEIYVGISKISHGNNY